MMAQFCSMFQMAFMIFVVFGEQIFNAIGKPVPAFYAKIKDNKWMFGLFTFFAGSQIQSALLSTGAFEIYVNDVLEFSKL